MRVLELRNITKKYKVFPAVDNVSFSVESGEILGYLGPNGAGKSTTIKMLAGLLDPTVGDIYFDGKKIVDDLYSYKEKIGYIPEESEIYSHLSAFDYLLLVGRLRDIPERTLEKKIEQFMSLFKLSTDKHSPVSSYSKGMIQKVLISAAFLHNPELLLLDEPLSGLDVTTGLIMRDLIRKQAEEGKIIIYSSHILEVVEKICTRIIILHKGRIVADDSVDNLRNLMKLPSLAEIFNQLVDSEDIEKVVADLTEAIKLK